MELIDEYTPLSDEEIERLKKEIKNKYDKNLKRYGVKQLSDDSYAMYQLIYLYKHKGKAVHKDVVAKFVQDQFKNAANDQQVRHLGSKFGYNVYNTYEEVNGEKIPSGHSLLVNLNSPRRDFILRANRRDVIINSSDFEKIKKVWEYKCATCGAKEGEPHKVLGEKVKLQRGHKDPNKPLELGNILPQCQYCNRDFFKDNFVFDDNGYPSAINNPAYVLRSTDKVQREMMELIKNNIQENKAKS